MTQQLVPARLKIKRAEKHLTELEAIIADFSSSEPYRLICEHKMPTMFWNGPVTDIPSMRMYHYKVVSLHPPPQEIDLVFGDVVHNLRAALDLVAYDLIVQNGGNKAFTGFPFHKTRRNFDDALDKGPISLLPEPIVEFLRLEVQTYLEGNGGDLWHMNRLDIIDKHRLLLTTEDLGGIGGDFKTGGITFNRCFLNNTNPDGYALVTGDPITTEQESVLSFQIVIAEQHFWYQPLVPTLTHLKAKTEWVVKRMEDILFGSASPAN